jgi:hypothetical protein
MRWIQQKSQRTVPWIGVMQGYNLSDLTKWIDADCSPQRFTKWLKSAKSKQHLGIKAASNVQLPPMNAVTVEEPMVPFN